MERGILTENHLYAFKAHLIYEEKSAATVEKYLRDCRAFFMFGRKQHEDANNYVVVTKELLMAYKMYLQEQGYAVRSINSMLASIHSLMTFLGWTDCKVKIIKLQKTTYCAKEKELTKREYMRLLSAAGSKTLLNRILQTICATGIRVSELKYFTVEAVKNGTIVISCKGKIRTVLIPGKLRKMLLDYAKKHGIRSGGLFLNKKGFPLHRSQIWAAMKTLCKMACVEPGKVFPHNLRKLFARSFYEIEKDIAKLADVLGHSSIDTTRIYIMSTGMEHLRQIERLGLVV